jgi:hypothetical protein
MVGLTNAGNYQGKILEHAVNVSSGGYPQLVLTLEAASMYDFDESAWADWSIYDQGTTAYLILAGKDNKPTKNCEQVMKLFKWDGLSFTGLDALPIDGMEIQFRAADHEYEGKQSRKVVWIDEKDAKPSSGMGQVEKLDAGKLSALDKQFSGMLKSLSGGKIAVAKAPAAAPKPPVKAAPKAKPEPAPVEEAPDDQAIAEDPDSIPEPAPSTQPGIVRPPAAKPKPLPAKPKPVAKPKPAAKAEPAAPEYDNNSAWGAVVAKTEGVDDGERAEAWSKMLEHCAPGKVEKDFTQEEWAAVVKYTIAELS